MRPRDRIAACGLAAIAALATLDARAEDFADVEARLQPYQMVRSLELVQDRIAGGDHAALPMQKKLLEMIDARFRSADRIEFAERRNFDALMVYAMSGGNPATVAASLEVLSLDAADSAAAKGVMNYLGGDVAEARDAMARLDLSAHTQEVGAFLALIKGSVVASDSARAGMAMLDQARLLAPGTLVEEAALRRTLSLAVTAEDPARFTLAAEQYARRFLRSPYAAQFAETFVGGILALKDGLDLKRIEQAVSWMTQEQAKTVYLRLARRAAIDGDAALLAFASARAAGDTVRRPEEADPRSELYASISSVTSETVEAVLDRLIELDASQLSAADRALLDAARTIATEVVAPVNPRVVASRAPDPGTPPAGAEADTAPPTRAEQANAFVLATRARLEEIDRMLEESRKP